MGDNKLFPDDEGQLKVAVFVQATTNTDAAGVETVNKQLVISFGKSIKWMSLGKPELDEFINTLQAKAEEL